jgi:heme exporter protein A
MLTVNALSCARGPRVLFRELSFRAEPGSFFQITGPNGSGKTRCCGRLPGCPARKAGTLEWKGAGDLAHARAYLGHAPGWKDTLSAARNLELAWRLDGEDAARDAGVIQASLERAGLSAPAQSPGRAVVAGPAQAPAPGAT